MVKPTLVIACGALAREIHHLKKTNGWEHLHLTCIDAALHFRPELIGEQLRRRIADKRADYDQIYVAYAECGTRGEIDQIIEEEGLERLPGAHCYQFFAGGQAFAEMSEAEPGTFYLTDFLVRHFKRLVVTSLGLDRHPELRDAYFGNYTRVIYLAQETSEKLLQAAKDAAEYLQLDFVHVPTGYGELETSLNARFNNSESDEKDTHTLA